MIAEIIRLQETGSTNIVAMEAAEQGAPHGTAFIAESQAAGRGRLGKSWTSPPGTGLYCSTIVRPDLNPVDYPKITFAAGLAVASAIDSKTGLVTGLKWPNDIYFETRKCGGILTESGNLNGQPNERYGVVGIGVNVNTEKTMFPRDIRDNATSLFLECGVKLELESLFTSIRQALLEQVELLVTEGFDPIIENWRKRDVFLGKRMQWLNVKGERVVGESLGPDSEGLLHVKSDDGKIHCILSGDVTLAGRK